MPVRDLTVASVDLYLAALVVALLVLDLVLPRDWRKPKAALAALGLLGGLGPVWLRGGLPPAMEFGGAYVVDDFALFFKALVLVAGAVVALLSVDYFRRLPRAYGEYYFLLAVVVLGCSLLVSAADLIVLYVAFEMVSLSSYVLAGYLRTDRRSNEAGLKYFLYGAAASAVMLYGLSWLYGLGQSTHLADLARGLAGQGGTAPAVAVALVLVGVGFKIAMAPFQAWVPDVYEGAPTPVTAFLSVAPKVAGFGLLLRLLGTVGNSALPTWPAALAVLATLTMFAGNLMALRQANLKRMLGYSSVAHAGYLLIGVVVYWANVANLQALLYYLVAYVIMNLGAFAVAIWVGRNSGRSLVSDYGGLARSEPVVAMVMSLFMLSLIGIPPTVGFMGKLLVFGAALRTSPWGWLAVVGIINAAISVYYYMNVVREMYFGPGQPRPLTARPRAVTLTVAVLGLATLVLGIVPQWVMPAIRDLGQFLWGA